MDMIINNYPVYKYNIQPSNQSKVSFKSKQLQNDEFVKTNKYSGYLNYQLKTSSMPSLFDGYDINESIQKPVYQEALGDAIPLLKKQHFTIEEYQNLSKKEKEILRNIITKNNSNDFFEFSEKNIKNDTEYILNIAKKIQKNLKQKYPNGYTLVSIGNSASPFVSAMEIIGEDTFTLPFSKNSFYQSGGFPYKNFKGIPYETQDWVDFFKFYGLDKNYEKRTGKKLIFTDYIATGKTVATFKNILDNLGFDKNTEIINFTNLLGNEKKNKIRDLDMSLNCVQFKYLSEKMSAKFYRKQNIDIIKSPYCVENQEERFVSKLFKFALFDKLERKKLPSVNKIFKKLF